MIDYLPIISTRASFIRERDMGRNYCVVKNCNSTSVDFSMFRVPKTLSSEWVQVLQRPPDWTPTSSSKICERHFEYFWGSVRPSVKNSKILHAVKRSKAEGLDRHEGPDQCFLHVYVLGKVKKLHSSISNRLGYR